MSDIVNPDALSGDAYFEARNQGAKVVMAAPEPEPLAEPAPAVVSDPPEEPTPQPAPEPEPIEPDADAEPPTDPEPEPEPVAAQPEPKPDSRTRRIRDLERQVAERDARMDRLLAAFEARQTRPVETKPAEPPTPEPAPQPLPRPTREAFDDPASYEAALVQWGVQVALRDHEAEAAKKAADQKAADEKAAQEQSVAEQQRQTQQQWTERRNTFIETHPDYVEVAESPTVPITVPMGQLIVMDAMGPQVAYYLGQNPQEAVRLAQITDGIELVMEFGAIKKELRAAATPPRPEVSRVPKPIVPVGTRSTAAAFDPDAASGDDYADKRLPELQKKRVAIGKMN